MLLSIVGCSAVFVELSVERFACIRLFVDSIHGVLHPYPPICHFRLCEYCDTKHILHGFSQYIQLTVSLQKFTTETLK